MDHDSDEATLRGRPDCSILVPVLNEERGIGAFLAALRRQRFDGVLEFLLVDGGSTDRTRTLIAEAAAQDDRIQVLENPSGATPSALNIALAAARGRWVARMDAHSEYPEDYVALGVARLQCGGTAWVSGPQDPVGHDLVSRAVALALATPLGRGRSRRWAPQTAAPGEYELDSGVFCGVWERETVLEYGGWDEHWLRNQDSEMAGRFLAAGERLVCLPAMAARYTPRNSLRALWRQYYQYGIYRARTAVRHPDTMRRSHLIAPGLVATLAASLVGPRRLRRPARAGLGVYTTVIGVTGVRAACSAQETPQALLVPAALAVMHLGHGSGFWRAAIDGSPPASAVLRALGLRFGAKLVAPDQDLYTPSLTGVPDVRKRSPPAEFTGRAAAASRPA